MATYERLDYGSPDGAQIGGAATDLVAFHGSVPVDQAAAITSATILAQNSGFGFSTSAGMIAAMQAINDILTCLREKGLIAS